MQTKSLKRITDETTIRIQFIGLNFILFSESILWMKSISFAGEIYSCLLKSVQDS